MRRRLWWVRVAWTVPVLVIAVGVERLAQLDLWQFYGVLLALVVVNLLGYWEGMTR